MTNAPPSRTADKFIVRLPEGMRERLAEVAKANDRSMTAEVVSALEAWLQVGDAPMNERRVYGTLNIVLDTNGQPISWHEIYEHLKALTSAASMNVDSVEMHIVTPEHASNSKRVQELLALEKHYRGLLRKTKKAERA